MLQVLDEGRLTDNQGRTVDFKNTIVIMTSNLGSHLIQEKLSSIDESNYEEIMGELRVRLGELLRNSIRPEFLNRIDEVVFFKPLLKSELKKIIEIQLNYLTRMLKDKNITINVTDEAKDFLIQSGYDVTYGARPLKRAIQRLLINPLSAELLLNKYLPGDSILVSEGERGTLVFGKDL